MLPLLCLLIIQPFLFLFTAQAAFAAPVNTSTSAEALPEAAHEIIINTALRLELHKAPQWRALLHYRPATLGGYESLIQDPAFFLSPDGRVDSKAELMATIHAIFSNTPTGDQPPACRFPARRQWLMSVLDITPKTLQPLQCAGLEGFLQTVNPRSVALVFPEAHINNPASMFGHTLIRLDSGARSRMLSYAVNYAAALPQDPGPLMVLKGIFGQYRGYFTALPYYEKIKEYSNMEARDTWEYGLNLTEEETRMMALHIWELQDAYADYFFLDDNCSYALMSLMEVARPGASLTNGFTHWVLPVDTIRAVKQAGLINSITYRPSRSTRIAHMESLANPQALQSAIRVHAESLETVAREAAGLLNDTSLGETQKIIALDLAAEYIHHDYLEERSERDEYTGMYLAALGARSTLEPHEYHIPEPASPETGHGPAMLALGYGIDSTSSGATGEPDAEGRDYALLRWRVAYHALMDPDAGYRPGAGISIFEAELRHYSAADETVLMRFMLFDITSLATRGNYIKPISWGVRLGGRREQSPEGWRTPAVLEGRAGMAWRMGSLGRLYGMADLSLKAGGALDDGYALGGGLSAGAVMVMGGAYKLALEGRALYYAEGDTHSQREATLRQTLGLTRDIAITLDARRTELDGLYSTDLSLGLNLYF